MVTGKEKNGEEAIQLDRIALLSKSIRLYWTFARVLWLLVAWVGWMLIKLEPFSDSRPSPEQDEEKVPAI